MRSIHTFSSLLTICAVVCSMLFLTNCSPTQSQTQAFRHQKKIKTKDPNVLSPHDEKLNNLSLADMLRRVPGVNVRGSGMNASVTIRGISSINLTNEPLYVIDGIPVGNNYASVATTLNTNDIKHIRVLKGGDATIYGARGANGVIVITRRT
ncbi:MAG: TonB-dependent receptor plug domain-containing protein [Bacteroidota bacterium]